MLIKIFLIVLGLPLLILPITSKIRANKKFTKSGKWFLVLIFLFAVLQITNEILNSKNEKRLENEKKESKIQNDSLSILTHNLKDTLSNFKKILISIDNKFQGTYQKISLLTKTNDSLNQFKIHSERPILFLLSSTISKDNNANNTKLFALNFVLTNFGTRSATNLFGKIYLIDENNEVFDNGTIPVSLSVVIPNNTDYYIKKPMFFNPELSDLDKPIYYYFDLHYSDLILQTHYQYRIAVKMNSFIKGKFEKELSFCKEWEQGKLEKLIFKK